MHGKDTCIQDIFNLCENFKSFSLVLPSSTQEKTDFLALVDDIADLQYELV